MNIIRSSSRIYYPISLPTFIIVLFLCFPFVVPHIVFGETWVLCGESVEGDVWYYDSDSFSPLSDTVTRVWVKEIISQERVNDFGRRNKRQLKGTEKLEYSLSLLEYDCREKQCRTLTVKLYSNEDKKIHSFTPKDDVVYPSPGTLSEKLMNTICRK